MYYSNCLIAGLMARYCIGGVLCYRKGRGIWPHFVLVQGQYVTYFHTDAVLPWYKQILYKGCMKVRKVSDAYLKRCTTLF